MTVVRSGFSVRGYAETIARLIDKSEAAALDVPSESGQGCRMHEFRKWLGDWMSAYDWPASDLARHSGIPEQTVGSMMNDDRALLDRMPRRSTIAGLARAFVRSEREVLVVIGRSMGIPIEPITIELTEACDEDLTGDLLRRLRERQECVGTAAAPIAQLRSECYPIGEAAKPHFDRPMQRERDRQDADAEHGDNAGTEKAGEGSQGRPEP